MESDSELARSVTSRILRASEGEVELTHLTIEQSESNGKCVLTAVGEVDLASAPDLESRLNGCLVNGPVVVDLSGVSFIDSTGLRVLLAAHSTASEGGHPIGLVVADGPVTKLLSITGVDGHLNIFRSVDSASSND